MAVPKDYIDSFLDDNERNKLTQFWDDEVMREAVRKVLLAGLYQNGTLREKSKPNPLYNGAFSLVANEGRKVSNEQIGEDLRTLWQGLNALEHAFSNISKYETETTPPTKGRPNSAR
jgi:hypothetical protein